MLIEKLNNYKLVLASQSPRRRQLLHDAGIPYSLAPVLDTNEDFPVALDKFQVPVFLAEKKSQAYGIIPEHEIYITADTIVWLNDRVINKPIDEEDAVKILTDLSGNMHEVITGVCLRSNSKSKSFFAHSEVYFSHLTNEEILHYVKTFKPFDKAGAYGIQEWIGYIGIEKINGSYFNVMGMPVQKLYRELESFL